MMAQKIGTQTIGNQTIQSSPQSRAVNQARAKQTLARIQQGYQQISQGSQEYNQTMQNLGTSKLFPFYEFNEQQEQFFQREGKDYSRDAPIQQLKTDPNKFFESYGKGDYDSYFKDNPLAQDIVEEYVANEYTPRTIGSMETGLSQLERENIAYRRQTGRPIDLRGIRADVMQFRNVAGSNISQSRQEYQKYKTDQEQQVQTENTKLTQLHTAFEDALSKEDFQGDFADRLSEFNAFAQANKDVIEQSTKNYQTYSNLMSQITSPEAYLKQFMSNPDYELINQGDQTIIREKPQQYMSRLNSTKGGKDYQYDTYVPHEIVVSDGGKIQSEIFRGVAKTRGWKSSDYKQYEYAPYVTKQLTFSGDNLATKQEFASKRIAYEKSGKDIYEGYETYQTKSTDFQQGFSTQFSSPKGQKQFLPEQKAQPQKDYKIEASNLFGAATNKLKVGETELTNKQSIKRQIGQYSINPIYINAFELARGQDQFRVMQQPKLKTNKGEVSQPKWIFEENIPTPKRQRQPVQSNPFASEFKKGKKSKSGFRI